MWPRIRSVSIKAGACPFWKRFVSIVVFRKFDKVNGELPPNQQFIDKRVDVLSPLPGVLLHLQHEPNGRDLTEVKIFTHVRNVIRLRLIAMLFVVGKVPLEEASEDAARSSSPPPERVRDGRN